MWVHTASGMLKNNNQVCVIMCVVMFKKSLVGKDSPLQSVMIVL